MARDRTTTAEPQIQRDAVHDMAAELFKKLWMPKSPTTTDCLAATCFAAAIEFEQIAARVRDGESPADIICPPELANA